jgi:hypothetical protein
MSFFPFFIIGLILVALAAPPAYLEESWKRFGQALALSFIGVVLPIIVFLLSAFLVPDWKGACKFGWVDCFHLGKLALLPLVLWATTAWYGVEVIRVAHRTTPLIVTGLWVGASVAGICFVYGLVSLGARKHTDGGLLWLFVPLYIAVWHGARAVQLSRVAKVRAVGYVVAFLGSLPFWIIGVFWSRRFYESLPDQPPSCFVVPAASRGHEQFVGPLVEVNHNGRVLRANRQLLTLWEFEALWRTNSPRSHGGFRRAYNVIGPAVARYIALPWLADLAYIAIKPAELLAAFTLSVARRKRPSPWQAKPNW